ncbi:MAG: hypothetical protein II081_03890, partial [Prevotella sp.]|nr:hypothetical protein [Prevotella sp.]
VHPEPGSNSSLYYCCTQISVLNLGFRLDVLFTVPLLRFLLPDGAHAPPVLCWPQTFKELFASVVPSVQPLFCSEADCKSTTFFDTGNQKIQLFLKKYYIFLKINDIKYCNIPKK